MCTINNTIKHSLFAVLSIFDITPETNVDSIVDLYLRQMVLKALEKIQS